MWITLTHAQSIICFIAGRRYFRLNGILIMKQCWHLLLMTEGWIFGTLTGIYGWYYKLQFLHSFVEKDHKRHDFLLCLFSKSLIKLKIMLPSGLGMSNWKEMVMMGLRSFCFPMVVIQLRYQISHGTNMSHGSFQVWPTTTFFKSGNLLTVYMAMPLMASPMVSFIFYLLLLFLALGVVYE